MHLAEKILLLHPIKFGGDYPIIRRVTTALLTLGAVVLFLINLRKSGERVGRLTERLHSQEQSHAITRQMLDAAADRPRSRDALTQRLRDGEF